MKTRRVCLLLVVCVLALALALGSRQFRAPRYNLVIIVLDAARADHVGCYGYPRPTTPNIDELATESVLFARHYCQIPFTTPSTASLFTGQYPDTHWVIYPAWKHEEPKQTMASILRSHGFATALFSSTPCASPAMGVGTHFEEAYYRRRMIGDGPGFSPKSLLLALEPWLAQRDGRRFFAYVHFLPPHNPYLQPEEMTAMFAGQTPPEYQPELYQPWEIDFPVYADCRRPGLEEPPPLPEWLNLYDANLRYGDWAVGEVVRMLQAEGLLDNTVVIVTSDHGAAFGEHGYIWHPQAIHQEVARIPLLVRLPGGARTSEVDALTHTIDLLPTICDLCRLPAPTGAQGASLVPLLRGEAAVPTPYTVTMSFDPRKYMIRTERLGLLLYENPE